MQLKNRKFYYRGTQEMNFFFDKFIRGNKPMENQWAIMCTAIMDDRKDMAELLNTMEKSLTAPARHFGHGVGCNTEVCPSSDGPCPCDDKS